MAQSAINREENLCNPEKIYKDLVYLPKGIHPEGVDIRGRVYETWYESKKAEEELCWSCGWTVDNQMQSSYGSRIRIIQALGNRGLWEVGSRWMIRDQPNDASMGNDFITQEFLRSQPGLDIPLIKEMRKLSAPTDKVDLTLMSRPQGVNLREIYHLISREERISLKNQLVNFIKKWRQFTSPIAKSVDGNIPDNTMIGFCGKDRAPTCKKMGRTKDEWFQNMEEEIRWGLSHQLKTKDRSVIDERFQELKNAFPKSEPYVLTHGDLSFANIIVKDGKIEAIINWDSSAYLPWWAERWLSGHRYYNFVEDKFFKTVWRDLDKEVDLKTFRKEVLKPVAAVWEAWEDCSRNVEHPNKRTKWLRPNFCNCKPWAGSFSWEDIHDQKDHKLGKDPLFPCKDA